MPDTGEDRLVDIPVTEVRLQVGDELVEKIARPRPAAALDGRQVLSYQYVV